MHGYGGRHSPSPPWLPGPRGPGPAAVPCRVSWRVGLTGRPQGPGPGRRAARRRRVGTGSGSAGRGRLLAGVRQCKAIGTPLGRGGGAIDPGPARGPWRQRGDVPPGRGNRQGGVGQRTGGIYLRPVCARVRRRQLSPRVRVCPGLAGRRPPPGRLRRHTLVTRPPHSPPTVPLTTLPLPPLDGRRVRLRVEPPGCRVRHGGRMPRGCRQAARRGRRPRRPRARGPASTTASRGRRMAGAPGVPSP